MRRGFKASAERLSASAREQVGLGPKDRLDPWRYAETLGILVFGADELNLDASHSAQLLQKDASSWSGMTLFEDDVHVVVLNSSHSPARQSSTLMHEIAHILLDHSPANVQISDSGIILLSDYSDEQEEEADWLGAALLLPETALLDHRVSGLTIAQVAEVFGVSEDLCSWRCRMTGVEKRLAYRRRA